MTCLASNKSIPKGFCEELVGGYKSHWSGDVSPCVYVVLCAPAARGGCVSCFRVLEYLFYMTALDSLCSSCQA